MAGLILSFLLIVLATEREGSASPFRYWPKLVGVIPSKAERLAAVSPISYIRNLMVSAREGLEMG